MNYLAHAFLSESFDEVFIGNFIGDAVKGKNFEAFEEKVQKGIILHRKIDFYTDCHPAFLSSRKRLATKFGRYASVIVDMYFDHFLAKSFNQYSSLSLHDFAQKSYNTLHEFYGILPQKIKFLLPVMQKENWLKNYENLDGVSRALTGLSKRARFENHMHLSIFELMANYELYKNDFRECFEDVKESVGKLKNNIRESGSQIF